VRPVSEPAAEGVQPPVHRRDRFEVVVGDRRLRCRSVVGLASSPDGDRRAATVTLVRAVSPDRALFDWWRAARSGEPGPDVRVALLDTAGRPVVVWRLAGATPLRWEGPELDALDAGPALERLHVAYEELVWER
jgi:phage tail-like protein